MIDLRDSGEGCTVPVRVHPGAKRDAITGTPDGALKISLTTPPTDGRANAALIAFLARQLDLPRSQVALLTGATSRSKTLRVLGLSAATIRQRLQLDEI